MGTIEKRVGARGTRYRARVRHRGRSVSQTFPSLRQARTWIAETEGEVRRNPHFGKARQRSLSDLVERYQRSPRWLALAPNDRRNRSLQLEWWLEWMGPGFRAGELSRADILDFLDSLSDGDTPSGRPLSAATRNRYLAAISAALAHGVEREWLPYNPALGLRRLREESRVRYLRREEDVGPGEEPELPRFLAAVRESKDPRLYPAVLTMLSTGCRRCELFESLKGTHTTPARWKDVRLQCPDGAVRIVIRRAKSGRTKTLVLGGVTAAALRDYARVRPLDGERYFFERGGNCRWPRREFDEALKRAGIADFRPHDLCHTAISFMVMAGRSLAEVASATDRTYQILQRYAHLSPAHAAGVTGSVQPFLDTALSV